MRAVPAGDGHDRLFEGRGGHGAARGTGGPERADGDLPGWNVASPGDALAEDEGRVVVLRPLPGDLDARGDDHRAGRRAGRRAGHRAGHREAPQDRAAPWAYRLTSLALAREGRLDGVRALGLGRSLDVDVRGADVGGAGDADCARLGVSAGFELRALTTAGAQLDGPQVTAANAAGGAHDWKRLAIPVPAGVGAADLDHRVFDASDDDGLYPTALGDALGVEPVGDDGAAVAYVRQGERACAASVDDDASGRVAGEDTGGPGGVARACVVGPLALRR